MNTLEIKWWESAKEEFPNSRAVMEKVEKMSKAEREAIKQQYLKGDDKIKNSLEPTMQMIALFRGYGLEKD